MLGNWRIAASPAANGQRMEEQETGFAQLAHGPVGMRRSTSANIAQKLYALWVTDPMYERTYLAKLDGSYKIGEYS